MRFTFILMTLILVSCSRGTGHEYNVLLNRNLTEEQSSHLLKWLESTNQRIGIIWGPDSKVTNKEMELFLGVDSRGMTLDSYFLGMVAVTVNADIESIDLKYSNIPKSMETFWIGAKSGIYISLDSFEEVTNNMWNTKKYQELIDVCNNAIDMGVFHPRIQEIKMHTQRQKHRQDSEMKVDMWDVESQQGNAAGTP